MPLPLIPLGAALAGGGALFQGLSNLSAPSHAKFDMSALNKYYKNAYNVGAQNIRQGVGSANQITAARLGQAGLGSSGILAQMIGMNEMQGTDQLAQLLAELEGRKAQDLQQQSMFDAQLQARKAQGLGDMFGSLADVGGSLLLLGLL